jgi:hypothetical protein
LCKDDCDDSTYTDTTCAGCPVKGQGIGFGNHVRVLDRFGRNIIIAHMATNKVGKWDPTTLPTGKPLRAWISGELVTCGEHIGIIASSGSSTQAHLHEEVWEVPDMKSPIDLFSGPMSAGWSPWIWQNYSYTPNHSDQKYRTSAWRQVATPPGASECYSCATEPGAHSVVDYQSASVTNDVGHNFGSLKERRAFQHAYGFTGYLASAPTDERRADPVRRQLRILAGRPTSWKALPVSGDR